jgi:hypothetical protein
MEQCSAGEAMQRNLRFNDPSLVLLPGAVKCNGTLECASQLTPCAKDADGNQIDGLLIVVPQITFCFFGFPKNKPAWSLPAGGKILVCNVEEWRPTSNHDEPMFF